MQRILVIQTAFIGDVVLATPLLEHLNARLPQSTIDIMVRKGNESLFTGHPFIHSVLVWDKKNNKYSGIVALIRLIRLAQYDIVINLQRYGATGIMTALSGAKMKIGFKKNPLSFAFTHAMPHNIGQSENIHEVDRNISLLEPILGKCIRIKPQLYPSADNFKSVYQDGEYVTIAPASVWYTKQLPVAKWADLIRLIPPKYRIILIGGSSDFDLCEQLKAVRQSNIYNMAGKYSYLQSAALMKFARMNYVNDSGPLHFCSSVNAATTAFFCSTVLTFGFGPLSDNSTVGEIRTYLDCRPCGIHGHKQCPQKHFKCGFEIDMTEYVNGL